jgi:hypothetical protein
MIQDARGNRKQAQEYYNRALVVDGGEGFGQVEAKRYLKTPYAPRPKDPGPWVSAAFRADPLPSGEADALNR